MVSGTEVREYSRGMAEGIRGERVRRLRERRDWSQSELARQMTAAGEETHPSHISAIEGGRKSMGAAKLAVLARVLETNVGYLLGQSDDDAPPSDLEEQIVIGVRDERSRAVLQEALTLLSAQRYGDQLFALSVLRRMFDGERAETEAEIILRSLVADEAAYSRILGYISEAARTGDRAALVGAVTREATALAVPAGLGQNVNSRPEKVKS